MCNCKWDKCSRTSARKTLYVCNFFPSYFLLLFFAPASVVVFPSFVCLSGFSALSGRYFYINSAHTVTLNIYISRHIHIQRARGLTNRKKNGKKFSVRNRDESDVRWNLHKWGSKKKTIWLKYGEYICAYTARKFLYFWVWWGKMTRKRCGHVFFRRNVTAASNGQPGTRLQYVYIYINS